MRKDLDKVSTEHTRYRKNPRGKFREKKKHVEDARAFEPVRLVYGREPRHGMNFAVKYVFRFLDSRLGRAWADVYSEFCEANKSDMGLQLREFILYVVDENVTFDTKDSIWYDSKGMRLGPGDYLLRKGEK